MSKKNENLILEIENKICAIEARLKLQNLEATINFTTMGIILDCLNNLLERIVPIKKGYKICRWQSDTAEYISAFGLGINTIYKMNEWTKRIKDCGPLAVFDNMENIEFFMGRIVNFSPYFVFECEYKESETKELYYLNKGKKISYNNMNIPRGTKFADEVKLIKRVD